MIGGGAFRIRSADGKGRSPPDFQHGRTDRGGGKPPARGQGGSATRSQSTPRVRYFPREVLGAILFEKAEKPRRIWPPSFKRSDTAGRESERMEETERGSVGSFSP